MKKLELQGRVGKNNIDSWRTITLTQTDGYVIDLVSRLRELQCLNTSNSEIQVNYHLSEESLSLHELKERHILSIVGGLNAAFTADSYIYSSWTSGTDYDTEITVGGHNMYAELSSSVGKYAYFEIIYS